MLTRLTGLAAGILMATTALAQAEETKLVTILTAPDAQTQLMAMVLTVQAAGQGATPHVLLCGPAADMALKDAPESATAPQPPKDISPQMLMKKIAGMEGAKVEVCAIYLPGRGAGPEVLLDGIGVAKPGPMAGAVLGADRVMSF